MSSHRLQRAKEDPTLELKIVSASDVSHMDAMDKMDVYAVVSLVGDNTTPEKQSAKTPIDYDGGSNPTWNHTVKFSVNQRGAKEGVLTIKVKLFSYWLENENDLYIGEVNVSVQELLASNPIPPFANRNVNKMKSLTYPIKVIGETKSNARLSLSYRFKPMLVNDLYPPPEPDYSPAFGQPIYSNPDPAISGHPIYSPHLLTKCQTELALELVMKHAKDIKKVNILDEMHVYASVTIREGTKTMKRSNTPIAFSAYQNPKWDHAIKFSLDEKLARDGRLTLLVELMSHRPVFGDKLIGEVNVSIQDLLGFNPLTNGDANDMVLVTGDVTGSYGKKGKLSFTFRFLREQVTIPKPPPSTNPQPFIMYLPISHQAYTSPDSGYVNVHPYSHAGPSNGVVPVYMPPSYQSHGYQHFSPQQQQQQQQSQPPPEKSQPRPQPHQQLHSSQEQPQVSPKTKRQGGNIGALGLGAAALGRAIGGALISDMMMSGEVSMYEFEA